MYIPRTISSEIEKRLFTGKAIILIGARQVGKSTMFAHLIKNDNLGPTLRLNCDEPETVEILTSPSLPQIKALLTPYKVVFIDEAQRIPNIGLTLKRIVDNFPDVQLLVTGSSAFELHNRINEPLTGRKFEYFMYPISTQEIYSSPGGPVTVRQLFEPRMIYGSYPEVITHLADAKEILMTLSESYLYKDILLIDDIRRSDLLDKILRALALQVGSEVSFNELAQLVNSNPKTVEKYITLLEQCYVIFRLPALSRNLRNEIKKGRKIYFWDNGVRNALIQNFTPLELRTDCGALWENFFISERIKFNHNRRHFANYYFWRTTNRQEVDLIEECDGSMSVFEMKYNPKRHASFPKTLISTYNIKDQITVTPDNYLEYLTI